MKKKFFYHLNLSLFLGIALFLFCPSALSAAENLPDADNIAVFQRLNGLDRHYDLTFLWYDRLAVGQLSFTQDPLSKRFRALLEAKTIGVAAWLTGDRRQRYETLMELTPQGRLLPLEYRAMIYKKKGGEVIEQAKVYTFDPATRTIILNRNKVGQMGSKQPVKIFGDRFPVDFLTAGFNYISGADGPIRLGERKEVVTFTEKGERKIVIQALKAEEWPKSSFFRKGSGTLLKITLPTEILDTGGGSIYALLDEKFLPQRVVVENVLGMGNVLCELRP